MTHTTAPGLDEETEIVEPTDVPDPGEPDPDKPAGPPLSESELDDLVRTAVRDTCPAEHEAAIVPCGTSCRSGNLLACIVELLADVPVVGPLVQPLAGLPDTLPCGEKKRCGEHGPAVASADASVPFFGRPLLEALVSEPPRPEPQPAERPWLGTLPAEKRERILAAEQAEVEAFAASDEDPTLPMR